MRVAILEDDAIQLAALTKVLQTHLSVGTEPVVCHPYMQGEALKRALRYETFDLLILDWNLPDLDGTELLHWVRQFQDNEVPVIMLTSRAGERDVVRALQLGADDFVVKPYKPLELCARAKRLLSRTVKIAKPMGKPAAERSNIEAFGAWVFDRVNSCVWLPGSLPAEVMSAGYEPRSLTAYTASATRLSDRELRLALTFFRNTGRPLSRGHLLECLGYSAEELSTRTLDSHVYRLRVKLALNEKNGVKLQTVYGQGYRLEMLPS
jgi:DNA-binding response OmpR family regulator